MDLRVHFAFVITMCASCGLISPTLGCPTNVIKASCAREELKCLHQTYNMDVHEPLTSEVTCRLVDDINNCFYTLPWNCQLDSDEMHKRIAVGRHICNTAIKRAENHDCEESEDSSGSGSGSSEDWRGGKGKKKRKGKGNKHWQKHKRGFFHFGK